MMPTGSSARDDNGGGAPAVICKNSGIKRAAKNDLHFFTTQLGMCFLPPAANGTEWEDISIWLQALEMIECGAPLLSSDV